MNMSSQVFNARRQRHHLLPIVVSLTALLSSCTTINLDGDHRRVESPPVFDLSIPLEEGSFPDPVLPNQMYEVSVCFSRIEIC